MTDSGALATLTFPRSARQASAVSGLGVPVRFVVDSGLRGIVDARIDDVDVAMLVHANAGFTAMLTHAGLHRVNGTRVEGERGFGLGHDLQLSPSGRGTTHVRSLVVAGHTMTDARIDVFDLPTSNWEGMLGVDWLASAGAIVDFGRGRLVVPSEDQRVAINDSLGFDTVVVPLSRDEMTGRFSGDVSVGLDSASVGRFVASTVADTIIDIEYARAVGIAFGEQIGEEHGPSGAVIPTYRASEPVTLYYGGETLGAVLPEVHDTYAYSGTERPAEPVSGYLGADLLTEYGAVYAFAG